MSPFFGAGQDPERIAREAGALVPDLGDSNLRRRLSVKCRHPALLQQRGGEHRIGEREARSPCAVRKLSI